MKDYIAFYLIDEADYLTELSGSDEKKLEKLVGLVQQNGSLQEEMEIDRLAFMFGLEAIGACFGAKELLATLTFNFSPMNLLGSSPDTKEAFGFINKVMAKDIYEALESRFNNSVDSIAPIIEDGYYEHTSIEAIKLICKVYLSVLGTASARGASVALLHNQSID